MLGWKKEVRELELYTPVMIDLPINQITVCLNWQYYWQFYTSLVNVRAITCTAYWQESTIGIGISQDYSISIRIVANGVLNKENCLLRLRMTSS